MNVQSQSAYAGREYRFVEDTKTALDGHKKQFKELLEEMLKGFKKFEGEWVEKINEWIVKAGEIEERRTEMGGKLTEFSRSI